MSDPQQPQNPWLPPTSPTGGVPPVPPAPGYGVPVPPSAGGPPAPPPAPGVYPGQGTASPGYAAPTGAYAPPPTPGAAPYGNPPTQMFGAPPTAPTKRSNLFGILALVGALFVTVVVPVLTYAPAHAIGSFIGQPDVAFALENSDDLSVLAPVRGDVLLMEVWFWVGTVVGIAALVLGIIAIVKRSGRAMGIAGVILSVLAPVGYFLVLSLAVGFGAISSVM